MYGKAEETCSQRAFVCTYLISIVEMNHDIRSKYVIKKEMEIELTSSLSVFGTVAIRDCEFAEYSSSESSDVGLSILCRFPLKQKRVSRR